MSSGILTIDDIASKNTPAIVDFLCEKNIRAIMFAVGQNVEKHYDEALYALKNGMIVGNHSYSHPEFSGLTAEQCAEEIEKNERVLEKLYADAGVKREYKVFRFPYGDKGGDNKEFIQKYLKENGFIKVQDTQITYPWWKQNGLDKDIDTYWTFDFCEYMIRLGSEFNFDCVMDRIYNNDPEQGAPLFKAGSRHLLLLHAHDETEEMVPDYYKLFINELLKNGFEFEKPAFLK